jgi:NADPH:quinone reductase-like Zn-dependent oxidoreductase
LCPDYKIRGEQINGTLSEYIKVPVSGILLKPSRIDFIHAAAYPLAFLTAYHMLHNKVNISKDQWILVWAAASGVGHAAVQIAKHRGAKVITTASNTEKQKFARKIGADFVINHNKVNISSEVKRITAGYGVDIVFEHVGMDSWMDSLKCLARGGKVVTCGATTGANVKINLAHLFIKHHQIIGSTMGNRQDMVDVSQLVEQGVVRPKVDRVFALNEIRDAHEYLAKGKQIGKIVINLLS